jgi:hypothetical protein
VATTSFAAVTRPTTFKIRAVGADGVPSAWSDTITVINGQ